MRSLCFSLLTTLALAFTPAAHAQVTAFTNESGFAVGTTNADGVTTISLVGTDYIRIQANGAGVYYTFWNAYENTDPIATVTGLNQLNTGNGRIYSLSVDSGSLFSENLSVEIRASDETTVKARGVIRSVPWANLTWRRNADTGSGSVVTFVTSQPVDSALAANDTVFFLVPNKAVTGGNFNGLPVGNYLPEMADAGNGIDIKVPGLVGRQGVIAFVREASTNATVTIANRSTQNN